MLLVVSIYHITATAHADSRGRRTLDLLILWWQVTFGYVALCCRDAMPLFLNGPHWPCFIYSVDHAFPLCAWSGSVLSLTVFSNLSVRGCIHFV